MDAIKATLGLRRTTLNDAVLIESGMPRLKDFIIERTRRFAHHKKLIDERDVNIPLNKVYILREENNTKAYRLLRSSLSFSIEEGYKELKDQFQNSRT